MNKENNQLREIIRKEIKQVIKNEGLFNFFDNILDSLQDTVQGELNRIKDDMFYTQIKKQNPDAYAQIKKKVGADESKIREYIKQLKKDLEKGMKNRSI